MDWHIVVLVIQAICVALCDDSLHAVETNLGLINGYMSTVDVFGTTRNVVRYLGIPYAEPPLGPRRLQKPVPLTRLPSSPYNATYIRAFCMQLKVVPVGKGPLPASEDCLYLNIYRPLIESSVDRTLPVMVYIHGGGFVLGTGNSFAGDTLASFGNVVVVSINYRLGIFGFFSSGDEHAPGNYGLWDQHVAIQWIHQYIDAFGGDPSKVTIFGTSAGSASVIYQSLYPGNEGLFQRGIASSGSVTCPWARTKNPRHGANKLGNLLGCNHGSTRELVECIRRAPLSEIDSVYNEVTNGFKKFPFDFTPTVDGEFVNMTPEDLLTYGNEAVEGRHRVFSSVDLLIGVNAADGGMIVTPFTGVLDGEQFDVSDETFKKVIVPDALESLFGPSVPEVVKAVVAAEYTNWTQLSDPNARRDMFITFNSDYHFNVQAVSTARLHARLGSKPNTYLYYFDTIPTVRMLDVSWVKGANHLDEMLTIFGYNKELILNFFEIYPELPEWEKDLSKTMMGLWTNFAKSGNPNLPFDVKQYTRTDWPAFHPDTEHYLIIQRDGALVGQRLKAKAVNFWTNIVPSLMKTVCKPCGEIFTNGQTRDNVCYSDGTCDP